jgi:hypothetical protein
MSEVWMLLDMIIVAMMVVALVLLFVTTATSLKKLRPGSSYAVYDAPSTPRPRWLLPKKQDPLAGQGTTSDVGRTGWASKGGAAGQWTLPDDPAGMKL